MKEALFYNRTEDNLVICQICHHKCKIKPDKLGICQVRKNIDGKLYLMVYEHLVSASMDPIEKKPLFNFYPGFSTLSVATCGCNMRCTHCQNHSISQCSWEENKLLSQKVSPEKLVQTCLDKNCRIISYTYTEPTIFYEYALDTMTCGQEQGIKNVWVTNGYISKKALDNLNGWLDAANVDLKSFQEQHYKKICKAKLEPVKETIKRLFSMGVWVEITTLIIPGLNDSDRELDQIAAFIASVNLSIPWHISRFHPTFQMTDRPLTPPETIHRAYNLGKKNGLHYVYAGNLWGDETESTFCHDCNQILIKRVGYQIINNQVEHGKCPKCQTSLAGVGLNNI